MKLALFPSAGLGDGLIQLVLAQNLAKTGIKVDYYHNYLSDMNRLIDHIEVKKIEPLNLPSQLSAYDVILLDNGSKGVDLSNYRDQLPAKLAMYSMSRKRDRIYKKRPSMVNRSFKPPILDVNNKSIDFNCFSGKSIRTTDNTQLSTARQITVFLKRHRLVESPDSELSLSFPADWIKNKHPNRILIHPTSAKSSKNWLPLRYVELASRLKKKGFEPVFSVAPNEKDEWQLITGHSFEIPSFGNILDLARYYFQSAMLVGNDSGNGHLASAMGLPTLTLVNRRYKYFPWRPNWSTNKVVKPLLSRKLIGKHYWKHSLSVRRVMHVFNSFVL